jgi:PAS domain S-box-containing protein
MRDASRFLGRLAVHATLRPALQKYSLALLLPFVALVMTASSTQLLRAPFFSLFSLAVLLSSIFGGTKPGLVTVAVSALVNAFVSEPSWSLRVASWDDIIRIGLFTCVGCIISAFVGATGELQRRLELERSRLSTTLKSIGDAVIATDEIGNVTFMNGVAEIATGWRLNEAEGLPLEAVFKIVNETSRAPVANPIRKVLEHGTVVGLANHTVLLRRDGTEIPIDDSAAPIRDHGGNIVGTILVFRDITKAKLSQLALLRAEKLATVGRLASTIAHEINNPLEAVSNLLFLIGEDSTLSEVGRSRADTAQAELARAAEITRQTLSFHKGQTLQSSVNLCEIVDSVLRLYSSRAAARGIRLENEIDSEVRVIAVTSQLRQLASNMVTNAIDAMPGGGILRINAELTSAVGQRQIRIQFSDTGHGIDPQNLNRIFEPFFTTKKDVGTGLGLWVTKRIVEDHDGELLVESRTTGNSGTTFTVVLPQEAVKEASTEA